MFEETNRVFAMTMGEGDDLVEDLGLVPLGSGWLTSSQNFEEFDTGRSAKWLVHEVASEFG